MVKFQNMMNPGTVLAEGHRANCYTQPRFRQVKEVKLRAQSTSILDPTSDMDEVLGTLEELHTTMNELQEQATEYKGYQKQFKVCDF